MAFKDRLKEARLNNGLTQEQVAEKIGVAKSTFTGYEKGNSEPSMYIISQIMRVLSVDANFLWQDEMDALGGNPMQLKYQEMKHIEKYRFISTHSPDGAGVVDTVLNREYAIAGKLKEHDEHIKELETRPAAIIGINGGSESRGRLIEYFRSVSAGTGQVIFDDVYSERIQIPDIQKYRRVAYAVKVDGSSMEPLYSHGDILLIEPTCEINVNEIGIFNVSGQAYVKQLGDSKLISLNKGYKDIPLTEDSLCMGRVVDKLSDY